MSFYDKMLSRNPLRLFYGVAEVARGKKGSAQSGWVVLFFKTKEKSRTFCFLKFFLGKIGNYWYFALMMKYSIFLVIYTSI